ncbi:hypothetical protein HDU88_003176 [Geranomyces variabilis]|nr:hypothetical protein HDU88_003176 [Geranomyces variabilis]
MTIFSTKHAYDDANVRIVMGNVAFLVHTIVLSLASEYFKACFRSPCDGLREIVIADVKPEHFSRLLDWIYRTEPFADPREVFQLAQLADRFQVTSVFAYLEKLRPTDLSWRNIIEWLNLATKGPRRFQGLIDDVVAFLEYTSPSAWVRVWYLAEKYDLPTLRDAKYLQRHSDLAFQLDPFFRKLSVRLQRDLLAACLDQCLPPRKWGNTVEVWLREPCTSTLIADTDTNTDSE